jgi:Spy/CpxP family protein refolding chaperone
MMPGRNAVISIEFLTHYHPMKRILTLLFTLGLLLGGLATSNSFAQSRRGDGHRGDDAYQNEDPAANSKLNNRRLEKNMDKYADQLQLSKRQQKQLKKIDRRYARTERKMKRRGDNKRSDRKRLAEEKRIEMISVLTPDQQQTLEALSKKGRFSFEQLFGR